MIFITGGNFQFLDASAPIYESERFVNTTNTILVFIQYRLGKRIDEYGNWFQFSFPQVFLGFWLLVRVLKISKVISVFKINVWRSLG